MCVDWTSVAHDGVQWPAVKGKVMYLSFHKRRKLLFR